MTFTQAGLKEESRRSEGGGLSRERHPSAICLRVRERLPSRTIEEEEGNTCGQIAESVGRRTFHRFDHQYVDGRSSWFEAQTELFLNGGKQGCAAGRIGCVVGRELHIEIK